MTNPILVTGAAGGRQGSTGKRVTELLLKRRLPVRAFVRELDERAEYLRQLGAEVIEGDLLDLSSVRRALQGIRRAFLTYPVSDGLLEATVTFAIAAREAGTELVVNLSQLQNTEAVPSFRNLQHRLADQVLNWSHIGAVHLKAPPFYENLRALIAKTVTEQRTIFLPWGPGDAVFPLVSAGDVVNVAAALLSDPLNDRPNEYDLIGETPTVNEIVSTLA